jgi:hypothetical protein
VVVPSVTDWTEVSGNVVPAASSVGPSAPKVTPVTDPVWVAPAESSQVTC